MKTWFNQIMTQRALALVHRLRTWIPQGCLVADIGSGTGHNAQAWKTTLSASVAEFDVSDIHWVGNGPVIFDGHKLPIADGAYDVVTLLFVLHYSTEAVNLLNEVRRISSGRILVIQSTYRGTWGRVWLNMREILWGPVAFYLARFAGMIRGQSCPLISTTLYSRQELSRLFTQAGLTILHWDPQEWWGLSISRDLYVLEPTRTVATCPSSSPPVMKCVG